MAITKKEMICAGIAGAYVIIVHWIIIRLSKKVISRFRAFNRKGRIQDTIAEMEFIQDNLYDTLMNVGDISQEQRMTVLKNLVAQVKKANSEEVIQNQVNLNESEKAKDVLRNIMFPLI